LFTVIAASQQGFDAATSPQWSKTRKGSTPATTAVAPHLLFFSSFGFVLWLRRGRLFSRLQNDDIRHHFHGTLIHHFLSLPLLACCVAHSSMKTFLVFPTRPFQRFSPALGGALGRTVNISSVTRTAELHLAMARTTVKKPVTVVFFQPLLQRRLDKNGQIEETLLALTPCFSTMS
jgi:hypothetical protein